MMFNVLYFQIVVGKYQAYRTIKSYLNAGYIQVWNRLYFYKYKRINRCLISNFSFVFTGYYNDLSSDCRLYHICKWHNSSYHASDASELVMMTSDTFLCPDRSRFDLFQLKCKERWKSTVCFINESTTFALSWCKRQ